MGRGLCLIEKDQINCPKFGHVEIKIVSDSDSDKTVKVWLYVYTVYYFERGTMVQYRVSVCKEEDLRGIFGRL